MLQVPSLQILQDVRATGGFSKTKTLKCLLNTFATYIQSSYITATFSDKYFFFSWNIFNSIAWK